MNCIKHPNEKIALINIHPDAKAKRLLCLDCYVEALDQKIPKAQIISINEVCFYSIIKLLHNPKLLFSLQQAGYDYSNLLQDHFLQKFELKKFIDEIKDLIQRNVNDLFEWLDQYSKQANEMSKQATQISKTIWESIEYSKAEKILRNIIQEESQEEILITEELNKVFAKLKIDEVADIQKELLVLKQQQDLIRDEPLNNVWKQTQQCFKQALQIFIQTHNKIFNGNLSKKIKCGKSLIIKNYQKYNESFKNNLKQPHDVSNIYQMMNKYMNNNFEIELVQTYTEFKDIDLAPSDEHYLIVLSNTHDEISVGYYKPINYKSNALMIEFKQSAIWEQISTINKFVKKRETFIDDISEYSIGNNFLVIDNNGQTTFQNQNNSDFQNKINQESIKQTQPKVSAVPTTQIQQPQQNRSINNNFFNQFNPVSSQQPSNQQPNNTFSQIFQRQREQISSPFQFNIFQQNQQQPRPNNIFNSIPYSQPSIHPWWANIQNQIQPLRFPNNNNQQQSSQLLIEPTLPNPKPEPQQEPLDQSNNQLKFPLGACLSDQQPQGLIQFKANLLQIYKVIPTYL